MNTQQFMKRYAKIGYPNHALIAAALIMLLLVVGGAFGYSIALLENAEETVLSAFATTLPAKQVLGTGAGPYYANPFEVLDARTVGFPVDQLALCRNWEECKSYCEEEENFQACVAWSQTLQ